MPRIFKMERAFERLKLIRSGIVILHFKAKDRVLDYKYIFWAFWKWFPLNLLYVIGLDRLYIRLFRDDLEIDNHFGDYHFHYKKNGRVIRPSDYAMVWKGILGFKAYLASWWPQRDISSWRHRRMLGTYHKPQGRE